MPTAILMDDETTWPADVLDYLEHHRGLFLAWELQGSGVSGATVGAAQYDTAIYGLQAVLSNHLLHGYHCTRLTESEIQRIISSGMQPPSEAMLHARVQLIKTERLIKPAIAARLIKKNQAAESNRAGKIWFCFFPPRNAGLGTERLFRSWGGEALYNSHERDPITGPILKRIGTPCLIEADVPIASLGFNSFLAIKVIRRFLINRGLETQEPTDHEDRANCSISAGNISRIIQYPDSDFVLLTSCDTWAPPLS